MLDAAIEKVAKRNERPVVHSDRGAHGGFNRLSQHLNYGCVVWKEQRVGWTKKQVGRRCVRRAVRRSIYGSSGIMGAPCGCTSRSPRRDRRSQRADLFGDLLAADQDFANIEIVVIPVLGTIFSREVVRQVVLVRPTTVPVKMMQNAASCTGVALENCGGNSIARSSRTETRRRLESIDFSKG